MSDREGAMRIVLAPDSFKETLSAAEVADALAEGMRATWPDAEYVAVPLADGGEGTTAALVDGAVGELVEVSVSGPGGEAVNAAYGLIDGGRTAVVEVAAASGLHLVAPGWRDPRSATSHGTGELVAAALDAGVERLILGLGGSATNDGGAGLLVALGVRLSDAAGEAVLPGGAGLADLATIDLSGLHARAREVSIAAACDVDNPLLGPHGATAVFGPQKGVDATSAPLIEQGLTRWADVLADVVGADHRDVPGAGAAGGIGFALLAVLGAELSRGFDLVADAVGLDAALAGADLVVTGEGRVDAQTVRGKAPAGVIERAGVAGVPVLVIGGGLGPDSDAVLRAGAVAVFGSVPGPMGLEEVMRSARGNLVRTAQSVAATWESGRRSATAGFDRSKER